MPGALGFADDPPVMLSLVFWYWFLAAPAAMLALFSLAGERKRAVYVRRRLAATPERLPPASVIVPVKGHDDGLRDNLAALAALDYPDYELIVAARSAADIPPAVLPRRVKVVLAHGENPAASEKVQNLAAAVKASRKSSEVFAFADSDGRVTARWLQALVAPLAEDGVGASTGYRWFMPAPAMFWALMRSVWNATAEGLLGPGDNPFAWGGATAVRKETFFLARVLESWKSAVSDDYALSACVRAAKLRIVYAPGALVPSLESVTGLRFFEWARRQMILTRFYRPRLWLAGLAAHILYCAGMAAGVWGCATGHRAAAIPLAAQLLAGMGKGFARVRLARAALPEYAAWFARWGWIHTLWVPASTWLWLGALAASALCNSIEWRGYRYEFRRRASG